MYLTGTSMKKRSGSAHPLTPRLKHASWRRKELAVTVSRKNDPEAVKRAFLKPDRNSTRPDKAATSHI